MNAGNGGGLLRAGRVCPLDYTYSPAALARAPDLIAETLYVVGGLYGNLAALAQIEAMAAAEAAPPQIVFNGDFHWFDAEPDWFARVEQGVERHRATRGNVETEVAREQDIGAGCGCFYPDTVAEDTVLRSNDILAQLATVAPSAARARLRALPMHLVAQVGGVRVGIVHGDAQALAGWRFAQDALDDAGQTAWFEAVRKASTIDIFACTHTCVAALRDFTLPSGRLTVANNGAAGMPNFSHSRCGLITRIATAPAPHEPLYGMTRDGVHIDALAVDYDQTAFLEAFLGRWPQTSPAYDSYFGRIAQGLDYTPAQAAPR